MLQRLVMGILRRIPLRLFEAIKAISNKISWIDWDVIEQSRVQIFCEKIQLNFEKEMKKIQKNKKVMIISEGVYDYTYFNAAYLNNMISLILYSLYEGCIPIININSNRPDANQWEWYFKQPVETVFGGTDVFGFQIVECDQKDFFGPTFETTFNVDSADFELWNFMYRHFVVINDKVSQYIQKEIAEMNVTEKKMGVLIRGTDYVKLKPKGHPVQPDIEELISEIEKEFSVGEYKYIYVATEEKKLFNIIVDRFGSNIVLSNKRSYYDEIYYAEQCESIREVHFNRENDNYLKGLEYLSSLIILSKCDGFIGSNCGGTVTALLFSEKQEDIIVINKGYY